MVGKAEVADAASILSDRVDKASKVTTHATGKYPEE